MPLDFVFDLVAVWVEATGVRIDYVLCSILRESLEGSCTTSTFFVLSLCSGGTQQLYTV